MSSPVPAARLDSPEMSLRRQSGARQAPRRLPRWLLPALWLAALLPAIAQSQERPARRVANIVGVAVEEYAKGVDSTGRLISQVEFDEAVSFLGDAREAAARLGGPRADSAKSGVDSLSAMMKRSVPPAALASLVKQIMSALGADAALELPTRPVDLAAGRRLYDANCASCHGPRGLGDGPLARTSTPPAPALGTMEVMRDVTPALMFRIVSVGVAGTPMIAWESRLTADERWDVISYINSMRASPERVAEGQGLYVQRCAGCHGATGASDGLMNPALSRLPAELSSFAWQAEKSDVQIAHSIRAGVVGAAMPPNRDLTDGDLDRVVSYVRTLSLNDQPAARAAASTDRVNAQRRVMSLLDEALAAARGGRHDEAADRAFDSYIAFEPMETPARARDPGMVLALERHFADFRGAIGANDLRAAERSRNAIEEGLKPLVAMTRRSVGPWGAFFDSFLIILREGFEAILVIGAIVALLIKTGHRERLRSIWLGVLAALGASALLAVVLATTLRAIPASREIIEGVTMLVAVAVLFSVSYWLISKVEAAKWQQFIREKVTAALEHGGGKALAFVAFLAVFREGAETALLYQALFHEDTTSTLGVGLGIVVGAAALVVIFTLFYRYGVRIPLRPFFAVTSALLYYLAFVFIGKGVAELQEGNVIPYTVLPGWPHIDRMGIYPTVETLLAQTLLIVLLVFALLKTFWPRRAVTLPTVPPEASPRASDTSLAPILERLERLERRLDAAEEAITDSARNTVGGPR